MISFRGFVYRAVDGVGGTFCVLPRVFGVINGERFRLTRRILVCLSSVRARSVTDKRNAGYAVSSVTGRTKEGNLGLLKVSSRNPNALTSKASSCFEDLPFYPEGQFGISVLCKIRLGVLGTSKRVSLSSRLLGGLSCTVVDVRQRGCGSNSMPRGARTCVQTVGRPTMGVLKRYSSVRFPISCGTLTGTTVGRGMVFRVGRTSLTSCNCEKSADSGTTRVLRCDLHCGLPVVLSDSDRKGSRVNSFACTTRFMRRLVFPRSLVLGGRVPELGILLRAHSNAWGRYSLSGVLFLFFFVAFLRCIILIVLCGLCPGGIAFRCVLVSGPLMDVWGCDCGDRNSCCCRPFCCSFLSWSATEERLVGGVVGTPRGCMSSVLGNVCTTRSSRIGCTTSSLHYCYETRGGPNGMTVVANNNSKRLPLFLNCMKSKVVSNYKMNNIFRSPSPRRVCGVTGRIRTNTNILCLCKGCAKSVVAFSVTASLYSVSSVRYEDVIKTSSMGSRGSPTAHHKITKVCFVFGTTNTETSRKNSLGRILTTTRLTGSGAHAMNFTLAPYVVPRIKRTGFRLGRGRVTVKVKVRKRPNI